ncbi:MAG: TRAP transporter small permease [Proteobacteria bacterium]|nr:TRAP transporter small permease [Pseudomonadota bacterium]
MGRIAGGWVEGIARGAGAIAALSALAMCLLITFDVTIRALFNHPIIWVPEIVGYLMVALVFLALGETMLAGGHIRIDLLVSWLPKRLRDGLELMTLTLSTGIAGLFTWHGLKVMVRSYQLGRRDAFGALGAPLWIPQIALPVGLAVLTLVLAFLVWRKFSVVFYGATLDDADPAARKEGKGL